MVILHDRITSIACQHRHDIIDDDDDDGREMASDVIEHDQDDCGGHTLVPHHSRTIKFLFNPMISLLHSQDYSALATSSSGGFMFSSIKQISSLEGTDRTLQVNMFGFINKHLSMSKLLRRKYVGECKLCSLFKTKTLKFT